MNEEEDVTVTYRKKRRKQRPAGDKSPQNGNSTSQRMSQHRPSFGNNGMEDKEIPAHNERRSRIRNKNKDDETEDDLDTLERRRAAKKTKSPPHRLPRSVSEEVLALEGKFNPERKSSKQRNNLDADPSSKSFDRPPTGKRGPSRGNTKKKKKQRESVSGEDQNYEGDMDGEISEIFHVKDEDYIQENGGVKSNGSKPHAVIEPSSLPSQAVDFMFIEKKDGQGFVKEHKSRVLNKTQTRTDYDINLLDQEQQPTALDFMMTLHHGFRRFSMIAHGLLAGIAVSQCLFIYVLDNSSSELNLLNNYYTIAAPYHSIYYFLLAICSVSVLDRYLNVSSTWSQFLFRLLSKPSRVFATFAYLLSLLCSVSITQLDDRINLFKDLPDLWVSTSKLKTWKVVNLLRVIGAVLGWIMVAIAPDDDLTERTIQEAIDTEREAGYELKSPRNGHWQQHSNFP